MAKQPVSKVRISWFETKESNCTKQISLEQLCSLISNDRTTFSDKVKRTRSARSKGDKVEYDRIKGTLPAVTISGTFHERKREKIIAYTQLMILDIDKISEGGNNIYEVKERVQEIETTCVCFISPSEDGLKVIVRVDCQKNHHSFVIKSLMDYYQTLLNIDIDISGKDLARLCFLSYDPQVFTNYSSKVFQPNMNTTARISNAQKMIDKRLKYPGCGRNIYVYNLACVTNKYGVDQNEVRDYCCQAFEESDFKAGEIAIAVASGYRNKEEFAIWKFSKAKLALDTDGISAAELQQSRSKLGVTTYINNINIVANIIIKDLEKPREERSHAAYIVRELTLLKKLAPRKGSELIIRTLLDTKATNLDELTRNRSPRGALMKIISQILQHDFPAEITERGKQVLIQEYCLSIIEQAFEAAFSTATNIPQSNLEGYVKTLKVLEKRHQQLMTSLKLTYELTLKEGSDTD